MMHPHYELPEYAELKDLLLDKMVFDPNHLAVAIHADTCSPRFIVRLAVDYGCGVDLEFDDPLNMSSDSSIAMIIDQAVAQETMPAWYPAIYVDDPAEGYKALSDWYRKTLVKDGRTIIEWLREVGQWLVDERNVLRVRRSMPSFDGEFIDARAYGPGRERKLKKFILGYKGVEDDDLQIRD